MIQTVIVEWTDFVHVAFGYIHQHKREQMSETKLRTMVIQLEATKVLRDQYRETFFPNTNMDGVDLQRHGLFQGDDRHGPH